MAGPTRWVFSNNGSAAVKEGFRPGSPPALKEKGRDAFAPRPVSWLQDP
jgi:hypothetical protein